MTDLLPPLSIADPGPDDGGRLRALIADIRATAREVGRLQAVLIRRRAEAMQIALAESARSGSRLSRERELPVRSVALEIAVATKTHDLTVQKELGDAHTLTEKFGATVDALENGRITLRHVQAILETGIVIDDDDTRRGWEEVVLVRAERDSPGRVRAFARELAESVQPEGMTARHARAAQTRGVSVRDLADGMAELSVILPATVAYGIRDRLRRQAAVIRQQSAKTAAGSIAGSAAGSATGTTPTSAAGRAERAAVDSAPTSAAEPAAGFAASSAGGSAVDSTARFAAGSAPPLAPDSPHRPSAPGERTSHDQRTLAQIGADLCADLLLTASPAIDPTTDETCPGGLGAIRAQVQITVPCSHSSGTSTPVRPSRDEAPSTRTPRDTSPLMHRGGIECCAIRSRGRCSRSIDTVPRPLNAATSRREINTVARPGVALPWPGVSSTTITGRGTVAPRD